MGLQKPTYLCSREFTSMRLQTPQQGLNTGEQRTTTSRQQAGQIHPTWDCKSPPTCVAENFHLHEVANSATRSKWLKLRRTHRHQQRQHITVQSTTNKCYGHVMTETQNYTAVERHTRWFSELLFHFFLYILATNIVVS
jgi:hypothetical protein